MRRWRDVKSTGGWLPHRRTLLQGLAGLAMAAGSEADAAAPGTFLAIGDWGREGLQHQTDVARAMALAAEEIGSRFVISTGDNFYPSGVTSVTDRQWKTSFEEIYIGPGLQTPWFVALGNHDYRGSAQAQVDYSLTNDRWKMPDRYFAVTGVESGIPQLDTFYIDTTAMVSSWSEWIADAGKGRRPPHDLQKQLGWLDGALARSTAECKIVVGHHPVFSGGRHGDTPELIQWVQPLLEKHKVQAYINGHDHILQHIRRGRVDYICSGSGASAGMAKSVLGSAFKSSSAGFATFACVGGSLQLGFRDFTGMVLYQTTLEPPRG